MVWGAHRRHNSGQRGIRGRTAGSIGKSGCRLGRCQRHRRICTGSPHRLQKPHVGTDGHANDHAAAVFCSKLVTFTAAIAPAIAAAHAGTDGAAVAHTVTGAHIAAVIGTNVAANELSVVIPNTRTHAGPDAGANERADNPAVPAAIIGSDAATFSETIHLATANEHTTTDARSEHVSGAYAGADAAPHAGADVEALVAAHD